MSEEPLLDSRDGYRSELLESVAGPRAGIAGVYLELQIQGKPAVEPELVASAEGLDGVVAIRRLHYLYRAMARFLNAGGTLEGLGAAYERFARFVHSSPQISLPPDIQVLGLAEDGNRQMLLSDGSDRVTVVVEDSWVAVVPRSSLPEQATNTLLEPPDDCPVL